MLARKYRCDHDGVIGFLTPLLFAQTFVQFSSNLSLEQGICRHCHCQRLGHLSIIYRRMGPWLRGGGNVYPRRLGYSVSLIHYPEVAETKTLCDRHDRVLLPELTMS